MASFFFLSIPDDPISDILGNISGIFEWFNGIVSIFFSALKYVLFVILIIIRGFCVKEKAVYRWNCVFAISFWDFV